MMLIHNSFIIIIFIIICCQVEKFDVSPVDEVLLTVTLPVATRKSKEFAFASEVSVL
jgi:hypothetical protein